MGLPLSSALSHASRNVSRSGGRMNAHARRALLGLFAVLGGSAAIAQQSSMPPMDMTPEEMQKMPGHQHPPTTPPGTDDVKNQSSHETHAPDPSLERPAASQHVTPPMMPGMDTDMNDDGIQH